MKQIGTRPCDPLFLQEDTLPCVKLSDTIYRERVDLLLAALNKRGLTHVAIFANREQFANMEYFIRFEPRFEEALFILRSDGEAFLLVGNECEAYAEISPIPHTRILYQNFSLQGQHREKLRPLEDIFASCGMNAGSRVGVVGYKYFYPAYEPEPDNTYDVPHYIMEALFECAGWENVQNVTEMVTGLPDGLRMALRHAEEVAFAEYNSTRTAGAVQQMIKHLRPGIGELELTRTVQIDFGPTSVFPMINFGLAHVATGLRSPDDAVLKVGDPCGVCYGVRGALTSRTGMAAFNQLSLTTGYETVIESFYKPFWSAICAWYESVHIGAEMGSVYKAVMDIIGAPAFGVTLNPGHYIGMDEWPNTGIDEGSKIPMTHSCYLQSDIIVNSASPGMCGICEDGVVIADAALRRQVAERYPEMWARITLRQKKMREVLGIRISDDVLPLSNLTGVYFPYMLDCGTIFAQKG